MDITIPDGVINIGNSVFAYCKSLTSIAIPASVTSIGNSVFSYCSSLTSIIVDDENSICSSDDGVLYNKEQTVLICCPAKKEGNVTIPTSVISIKNFAFADCDSLTNIVFPTSVTSIGDYAFYDCDSVTSITLPDTVTDIGTAAFMDCDSLTSITISSRVTSIGNSVFAACGNLTSITLPRSVTSIDKAAFKSCSGLKNIYYSGTEADWNEINIGDYNICLTNATIYYNFAGSEPEHVHFYSDEITTVATCGTDGIRTYNCSCGEFYTEVVPATGEHTWNSGKVKKNPSITETGAKIYTCSVCKKTKKETIPKLTKTALNKATVTLAKTSVTYTGKAQKPTVTVKITGVTVPSSQYTVSYSNNTKAGTAKVTIKAATNATYVSGNVTKTFTITKAANTLTVSPTSKSLTVAKCKKQAQTFTIKVKNAKGTVSYKSSKTKYVTVSKGKVTVKKGTPKGTYKVTVTAKGNSNYKSGSKKVTITVK
jgi:hypothetical protein